MMNTNREFNRFLSLLKASLLEELPGRNAQFKMAPELRLESDPDGRKKKAAVLILLYPYNRSIHTVLMKRTDYPGPHSGQISFPGGKFEESDLSLEVTAVREAGEELGIETMDIQLLGNLSTLDIPVSGMNVLPVIGCLQEKPLFSPHPEEVTELIEVPVIHFMKEENRLERIRTILCKIVKVPYYQVNSHQVWGATAMILSEFLDVLRKLESPLLK